MPKRSIKTYETEKLFINSDGCDYEDLNVTIVGDVNLLGVTSEGREYINGIIGGVFVGGNNSGITIDYDAITFQQVESSPFNTLHQYSSFVDGGDGNLYAIPANADHVLVFNPSTQRFYKENYNLDMSGANKWSGGTLASNGKIYCSPFESDKILVINTNNQSAYYLSPSQLVGMGSAKYTQNPIIAANDRLYFTPFNMDHVMYIDTATDAVSFTNLGLFTEMAGMQKWSGGIISNNKIYCIPYNSSNVLIIDTSNNTGTINDFGLDLSGSAKWSNSTFYDSKIFSAPLNADGILVIDTDSDSATINDYGFDFSGISYGFGSITVGLDNKLYLLPYSHDRVVVINLITQLFFKESSYGINLSSSNKFGTGVPYKNGMYYLPPDDFQYIAVINTKPSSYGYDTMGTVPELNTSCVNKYYGTDYQNLNFTLDSFTITFTGDLTGQAYVRSASSTSANLYLTDGFTLTETTTTYPSLTSIHAGTHSIHAPTSSDNPVHNSGANYSALSALNEASLDSRGMQIAVSHEFIDGDIASPVSIRTKAESKTTFTDWKDLAYMSLVEEQTAQISFSLTLSEDATGTTTFVGLGDAVLNVQIEDDSHLHTLGNTVNFTEPDIKPTVAGMFDQVTTGIIITNDGNNNIEISADGNIGISWDSVTNKPIGAEGQIYFWNTSPSHSEDTRVSYPIVYYAIAESEEERLLAFELLSYTLVVDTSTNLIYDVDDGASYNNFNLMFDNYGGRFIYSSFNDKLFYADYASKTFKRITLSDLYTLTQMKQDISDAVYRVYKVVPGNGSTSIIVDDVLKSVLDYRSLNIQIKILDNGEYRDASNISYYSIDSNNGIVKIHNIFDESIYAYITIAR